MRGSSTGFYRGRGEARGGRGEARGARGGRGGRGGMMHDVKKSESINKKFVKKFADKAAITSLLTQNKSFSLQRLMRDYNEIKNSNFCLYGVSAAPLDTDFFTWHGNVKAIYNKIYKGCVIHLQITFTDSYPVTPPTITVLNYNSLKHPNIMPGGKLCLDMLDVSTEKYKGWTSGYTVFSILLQLQNFFFDTEDEYFLSSEKKEISEKIKLINEYKCGICPHKGSSNPWPEFNNNENQKNILTPEKYKEEKKKEYVCFHRKSDFEESPLGIGISIAKIPRSGVIGGVVSRLDYISLKAYTKQKLRKDIAGQPFTHWFPLYFGVKEEQFLHLCKKSLSMIVTGSTKNFSPSLIFKIIPKFFISLVTEITSENVINSSRSLKILIHIYRVILLLAEKYPGILEEFENSVEKFIEDKNTRHKDITSSLGDLLVYVTISKKNTIEKLLPAYMEEQMDRQIFWILQAIPELEDLIESSKIDDVRAKVCFKSFTVGAQILLFFVYFNKKIICKNLRKSEETAKILDANYGCFPEDQLDSHQKVIKQILKIDNFSDYYKFLEIKSPTDKEINEKLKQAYINSLEKGYHGFDAIRYVPDQQKQMMKYFERFPALNTLYTLTGENKTLLPEENSLWENLVLEKFDIVNEIKFLYPSKKLTPEFILLNYEKIRKEKLITLEDYDHKNYPRVLLDDFSDYTYKRTNESDKLFLNFSWRKLYIKLFLELYIQNFEYLANFKELYEILDLFHTEVTHLNIDINNMKNLKSDYNYLRVIISKLVKLKYLCLNVLYKNQVNGKLLRNLNKGLSNFKNSEGALHYLKIFNRSYLESNNVSANSIINILEKLPEIKVLDLSDSLIGEIWGIKLRNHFYYFKSITTLILTNCKMDDKILTFISDGMMKAKGIEEIYLNKNQIKNISNLINNLAFQPSLKVMDISDNPISDLKGLKSAISKMLKMSQSLKTLILRNIFSLGNELDSEFFYSLGDNYSLEYLDLSEIGNIAKYAMLGNAIAFNSLKKGALKILHLDRVGMDYNNFSLLVNSLSVSEDLHKQWYGSSYNTEIVKDTKEYYENFFYNNLKFINFANNSFSTNENVNDLKLKIVNILKILIENSKNLEGINFEGAGNSKYFTEMLVQALYGKNNLKFLNLKKFLPEDLTKHFMNSFFFKDGKYNDNIKLVKLNLSDNNFGYSGIESLSNALKKNTSLKTLDLYKNIFDVNGARRLSESLLINSTLETLDIGYNRIKDLGMTKIMSAIVENKSSKIKDLSVRCNLIKNLAVVETINLLLVNKKGLNLQNLLLTNNSIDETTINDIFKSLYIENDAGVNSDLFSILYHNSPSRIDRCVWITAFDVNNKISKRNILDAIEEAEREIIYQDDSHIGIPLDIRIFKGRNIKKKFGGLQAFVEFIDPNSVNRILKVVSTKGFIILGKKMKIFKAGSKIEKIGFKKKRKN